MALKLATFGGGCFWGMEKFFKKQFGSQLHSIKVGYTGGTVVNPSYEQTCTGKTGHAEAVQMSYDPSKTKYEDLVEFFFRCHNPTTLNRQGNDVGTQYRSAVFYEDEEQKTIAAAVMKRVDEAKKFPAPIVTTLEKLSKFYDAEAYHQAYLDANPGGYCNHRLYW